MPCRNVRLAPFLNNIWSPTMFAALIRFLEELIDIANFGRDFSK
ncbi:hypothetical protein AX27061_3817 [Achromobacter xylosoxidans NBRC 15126 = ATCC 27061]|nr:hypothetical protein AX27061_3817 [Achromobacter xylosoxidans NBRC 15126 = ATCC 27061]